MSITFDLKLANSSCSLSKASFHELSVGAETPEAADDDDDGGGADVVLEPLVADTGDSGDDCIEGEREIIQHTHAVME